MNVVQHVVPRFVHATQEPFRIRRVHRLRRLVERGAYRPDYEEAALAWLLDELTARAAWEQWVERAEAVAAFVEHSRTRPSPPDP